MIKFNGKKLTPKRAAQLIIEDVLMFDWHEDSHVGQGLDQVMTARERELIQDQLCKILGRFDRYL